MNSPDDIPASVEANTGSLFARPVTDYSISLLGWSPMLGVVYFCIAVMKSQMLGGAVESSLHGIVMGACITAVLRILIKPSFAESGRPEAAAKRIGSRRLWRRCGLVVGAVLGWSVGYTRHDAYIITAIIGAVFGTIFAHLLWYVAAAMATRR